MLARYLRSNDVAIIAMAVVTALALAWAFTRPASVVVADSSKQEAISARIYDPNCANPADRETADLCTQQEMAWWAQLMTITTAVSVLISAGGVVLLLATLRQNRSAVRIGMASLKRSNQSVRVAERQLIADSRPWIKLQSIAAIAPLRFLPDENGNARGGLDIAVTLKNVGKTPALNVSVYTRFLAVPFAGGMKLRDLFADVLARRAASTLDLGLTLFPDDVQRSDHNLTLPSSEIDQAVKLLKLPGKSAILPGILICIAYDMPSTGKTHETGLVIHVGQRSLGGQLVEAVSGEIPESDVLLSRTIVGGYVT